MLSSSFSLWHSFDSVKGTNTFLWTCLGLSLIVSLTVFVLMFLLRKMSSEPLKDKLKNTGWFDGWSLKSLSKRWLLWISIPFLLLCCVYHLVSALLSMLDDSWVKWTLGRSEFPFWCLHLLCWYHTMSAFLNILPLVFTLLKYWGLLGKHPSLWPKSAHWLNITLSEIASRVWYYPK